MARFRQLGVYGSNQVIGKIYMEHCLLSTKLKRQNKEKRSREWPILKNKQHLLILDMCECVFLFQDSILIFNFFRLRNDRQKRSMIG